MPDEMPSPVSVSPSQDLFVQHEAARTLLEAHKHGGALGISQLSTIPGFLQGLVDAVSSQVQVIGTSRGIQGLGGC